MLAANPPSSSFSWSVSLILRLWANIVLDDGLDSSGYTISPLLFPPRSQGQYVLESLRRWFSACWQPLNSASHTLLSPPPPGRDTRPSDSRTTLDAK
ncbi:hypothetical protein FB45DRAFT_1037685 [Roridomyces roridus]|uniref:Secreted protein n=1 Tax=Roridomyces roridus TaxID=1738132 RepID=A0AAD7B4S3_9AGAR|nr:hypothetical protein FB45DRAFT_1037685 [Roridomyces roridus]